MNPFNRKVRAIIRREYLQKVRSKWFLFSTLGLPILMVGLALLSGWLVTRGGSDAPHQVGVVDGTGRAAELLVAELERESFFAVHLEDLAGHSDRALESYLLTSGFHLLAVLPEGELDVPLSEGAVRLRVVSRNGVDMVTRRTLRQAADRALLQARLEAGGVEAADAALLLQPAELTFVEVGGTEASSREIFRVISFVLALAFYMVLLVYGQMIVRSILEEKTSDIVEVMVSSVRPHELMMGKIVGVGAVGLTQVAIWGIVLTGLALYGVTGAASALAEAGIDPAALTVPVGLVAGILLFLVLGYLLYAGLFAGTGATLGREEDAQQASLPVVILIIIPFVMAQGIIEHPDTALSVGLSLVPFFSPLLMPSRMLVTSVPLWQMAVAIVLLMACILLVAWLAGRIYRVGILMKGKRPNLPEVARWIRHG